MHDSSLSDSHPAVSIILPTYNRARFLPQAFNSIAQQTFSDWELIVVDDGSQDDTAEAVERLRPQLRGPILYYRQENAGPAMARNAGIDRACGKYVAFFDSDDIWLPHHLEECVTAFERCSEVEWIFCAGQRVNLQTNSVIIEHTFYKNSYRPRFLDLRTRQIDNLRIFDDPGLLQCALRGASFDGLQSSMIRREVFKRLRFEPMTLFEDRLALIRAVALGVKMGYIDKVNVIVYSHDANVSLASGKPLDYWVTAMQKYLAALQGLEHEFALSRPEYRALRDKQGEEAFWMLGYCLFQHGRRREGLHWMRYALSRCPSNLLFWKAYLASLVKALLPRTKKPALRAADEG